MVRLYLSGSLIESGLTTPAGRIAFHLDLELQAGTYAIRVEFAGSEEYPGASASTELVIEPAILEIHTVPKFSGARFSLGGRIFSSDEGGVAKLEVNRVGVYSLEVLPINQPDGRIRAQFVRWDLPLFSPIRQISIPRDNLVITGFEVDYQVNLEFVDLAGTPLSAERITSATVRQDDGTIHTWNSGESLWLKGNYLASGPQGPEDITISYTIDSVIVDGSNVVDRGMQPYSPDLRELWQIQVSFYLARFAGRDALFGNPLGSGISLTYPNGETKYSEFEANGELAIGPIPRGLYRVKLEGAPGISLPATVVLPMDQQVRVLVISYIDLAAALLASVILAVGIYFSRRREQFFDLRARLEFTFSQVMSQISALLLPVSSRLGQLNSRLGQSDSMPIMQAVESRLQAVARPVRAGANEQIDARYSTSDVTPPTIKMDKHPKHNNTALIRINTASIRELSQLPGVGKVLAQRIVRYRETHGPFTNAEELLKVYGISNTKLVAMRDLIWV
jgi:competence ComEA-like helix-hairpin-helix protein